MCGIGELIPYQLINLFLQVGGASEHFLRPTHD
jgi:hypothetical protein